MKMWRALTLALAPIACEASPLATKVLLDATVYEDARCLDGSMGAFYWSPGTSTSKFYLHQQGGGCCDSLKDCKDRSKTSLGSSRNRFWPSTNDLETDYEVFRRDPAENPLMHNWNHIFMVYCDGGYFSGSNDAVLNGVQLHFRGAHILDAVLSELAASYGLSEATDVVLGGCSAGGIATFLHVDYVAEHPVVPSSARVSGFPQSGYFPDWASIPSFQGGGDDWAMFQFNVQNISGVVNRECLSVYAKEPWKCIYEDVIAPFVRTPLFLWQSAVDADQLDGDGLDPPCSAADCAIPFAEAMMSSMKANVFDKPQNGGFIDYCNHHCGDQRGMISDTGYTRGQTLAMWYQGSVSVHNQTASFAKSGFPCQDCCPSDIVV